MSPAISPDRSTLNPQAAKADGCPQVLTRGSLIQWQLEAGQLRRCGHPQLEYRALADRALYADRAAMRLGDRLDYRQAEAKAAGLPAAALVNPGEPAEDAGNLVRRYARA